MKIFNKKHIFIGIFVYVSLLFISYFWAQLSLVRNIEAEFVRGIASEPSNKSFLGIGGFESKRFFMKQLTTQLNEIDALALVPIFVNCQCDDIRVAQSNSIFAILSTSPLVMLKDPLFHGVYTSRLRCELRWLNWLVGQFIATLLILLVIVVLPKPLSQRQKQCLAKYNQYDITVSSANKVIALDPMQQRLFDLVLEYEKCDEQNIASLLTWTEQKMVEKLTTNNLAWFTKALTLGENKQSAFYIGCEATQKLIFLPLQRSVVIRGLLIKLPPTPFFYYLWYANQRLQNDGWILNPQTNKPDAEQAEALISLMSTYKGHGKAINDLERNGLTAKKLDQNRNKIKEEISLVVGESLAMNYLFGSQRDYKTQRYAYRLNLLPEQIIIEVNK
ncbi:hypothetical protein P4S73_24770 [Paraglaciecola sp. Hal342]